MILACSRVIINTSKNASIINSTIGSYKCRECEFVSDSQGGLGVHRVKKLRDNVCENIQSVSVVCEYPKGKTFYCCLCDNIIKSWPNFTRHFRNIHPKIPLTTSAWCSLCNRVFNDLKGVGVHMKREHDISSSSIIPPSSPSPIMSVANFNDSQSTTACAMMHDPPDTTPPNVRVKSKKRTRKSNRHSSNTITNQPPVSNPITIPSTNLPSPPSSTISQTSSIEPSLEPTVALNGCTAVVNTPPFLVSLPPSEYVDPMVALSGCTNEVTIPNAADALPDAVAVTDSSVPFTGCTDDELIPHILVPPPSSDPIPISQKVPEPVICDLSPIEDDDDPFNIPPPLSSRRFLSQSSFVSRPSSPTPPHSLNPDAPDFQPTQEIPLAPPPGVIPSSPVNDSSSTNGIDPDPTNSPSDSPSEDPSEFSSKWKSSFAAHSNWQEFSEQCNQFAKDVISECEKNFQSKKKPVSRRHARPSARPVSNNRRPVQYNPIEARRIQSLYRLSKKRAARQVINDNKPSYSGSVDEANDFFSRVFGEKSVDVEAVKKGLDEFVPSGPKDDALGDPITAEEVSKKLRSMSNSAPGADRVEYRHLKSIDPKGQILCNIFNRCLIENDVPSQWKTSRTVLIHKKGDASDVSNFRPIALMSCIYKLFMSIMANRLVNYSIDNNLLSSSQKSARPTEGCYEHTFILQSLVLDAKRHQKNIFLAWLDLRNAFGSIPHDVITLSLSHLGVPDSVVNLVKNIYTNATTEVRTPNVSTPNIPIHAGVKQGCPLSPIIFNLCIEIILRAISMKGHKIGATKHFNGEISVLAYADDLVIIAKSKEKLQQLLDAASSSADVIGLEFRQDKSASLSMTYSKKSPNNIEIN